MFLTFYLWEEAKHIEGFDWFLREITETDDDLEPYFTALYRQLVLEELLSSLARLHTDDSPEALAQASITYQMIVEGVLAETGYSAYHSVLHKQDLLPGMQEFIGLVQRDESRHVTYGVFLLSRLVAEHGDQLWTTIEDKMNELLPLVLDHIQATLAHYEDPIPFRVTVDQFIEIGSAQFEKRLARIERARSQSLNEVLYGNQDDGADRTSDTRPAEPPSL